MEPAAEWFHGVMVSTLDSESSDPSSNLGGTFKAVMPHQRRQENASARGVSWAVWKAAMLSLKCVLLECYPIIASDLGLADKRVPRCRRRLSRRLPRTSFEGAAVEVFWSRAHSACVQRNALRPRACRGNHPLLGSPYPAAAHSKRCQPLWGISKSKRRSTLFKTLSGVLGFCKIYVRRLNLPGHMSKVPSD